MLAENGACFSTAVRAYFQSVSNADSPPHAGLAARLSAPAEAQDHSVNRLPCGINRYNYCLFDADASNFELALGLPQRTQSSFALASAKKYFGKLD